MNENMLSIRCCFLYVKDGERDRPIHALSGKVTVRITKYQAVKKNNPVSDNFTFVGLEKCCEINV